MEDTINGGGVGRVLKAIFTHRKFWIGVGVLIILGMIALLVFLTSYELWGNRLECENWGGAYFVSWIIFLTGVAVGAGVLYKYMSKKCNDELKSKIKETSEKLKIYLRRKKDPEVFDIENIVNV